MSIPVRDMPTILEQAPIPGIEHEPLPLPRIPGAMGRGILRPDAAVPNAVQLKSPAPAVGLNFVGEGATDGALGGDPSDSEGHIGATQYVEWINTFFAVYDKTTGALKSGPTAGNSLFASLGGDCANTNDGDPIAQYDRVANRWVLAQFAVRNGSTTSPYHECVAVSKTSDAIGAYNLYDFTYTDFNDYPKIGIWQDKALITFNLFQASTVPISKGGRPGGFVGALMCAYDLAGMEAGTTLLKQACSPIFTSDGGILPADIDGANAPPASEHGFFLELNRGTGSGLNLWSISSVDFTGGSLTLSGPSSITVPAFVIACNGGTCIPQNDGGANPLDSLGDRLMYRVAYRNFPGDHDVLLASHSVDVTGTGTGQTGVRWYEVRNPGGTPTLFQSGSYAPDSNFRWMGSVAMDKSGDIGAGYSLSSSTMDPSIAISTRSPADALGTLGNETTLKSGSFATARDSRWGDYTALTVDPVDDCTLWYINQFVGKPPGGQFDWDTDIANFEIPGCGGVASFKVQAPASAGAGVPFSATVTALDANNQTVTGYTGTVHFTLGTPDAGASVPADYTFVAGDAGSHTFGNGFTLVKQGAQNIIATDTVNASLTGTSSAITVGPGPATHFAVSAPANATAGISFSISVTALDQFNNTAIGYSSTVHFTSTDPQVSAGAGLPADSTLTNGVGNFTAALKTAGGQTITATDKAMTSITGTSGAIAVSAAGIGEFGVSAPLSVAPSTQFTFQVTAEDAFGNIISGYTGTAHFAASGTASAGTSLPANYTFSGAGAGKDNGTHQFVNGATSGAGTGTLTITANDTVTTTATGSATLNVTSDAPLTAGPARTIKLFKNPPQILVGTFTDADNTETGSNPGVLSASIDWGDGSAPTAGTIPPNPGGGNPNVFQVFGSHAYARKGKFKIIVTVSDSGGSQVQLKGTTVTFFPRNYSH